MDFLFWSHSISQSGKIFFACGGLGGREERREKRREGERKERGEGKKKRKRKEEKEKRKGEKKVLCEPGATSSGSFPIK